METRGDHIRELFLEAAALPSAHRSAFLEDRCDGNADLRAEVESLLRFHDEDTGFLDGSPIEDAGLTPISADMPDAQPVGTLEPGSKVASFTVVRLLGAGGMGVVYEAMQESPRRPVALKLMRAGFVSRAMLRRFQQEAQALALLRHPGIAQVYEAGMDRRDSSVVPYLAMELVEGESITSYLARHSPTTRQRLEMFGRLCDAVSHAHQRGVVHRDLKPPNILVDARGQPKILDFGIARLAADDSATATLSTQHGQILGTLSYISPEQLSGDPSKVDVRADVYALGVILYEILSGRLPHDLSKSSLHDASRILREVDAPRLGAFSPALRGDIETIARKAMEKDVARRYQSAAELAEDVARHLRHEPILALPPSTWYRVRKFTRRNRAVAMGAAAVFLALTAGLVTTLDQARRARTEAIRANEQATLAEEHRRTAENESRNTNEALKTTNQINTFMSRMFMSVDPARSQGKEVTLREVLDDASQNLRNKPDALPYVTGTLNLTFAQAYSALGEFDKAEPCARDSFRVMKEANGPEHRNTLLSMRVLSLVLYELGKLKESDELTNEAYNIALRKFGPDHELTKVLLSDRALIADVMGRDDEAIECYRLDLESSIKLSGESDRSTLVSMANIGVFMMDRDRIDEAAPYLERNLELCRQIFSGDHPQTNIALANLGGLRMRQHRYAEAEDLTRQAIDMTRRLYGPETDEATLYESNLGSAIAAMGRFDEADAILTPLFDRCKARLGENQPNTLETGLRLLDLRIDQKRLEEAEPLGKWCYDQAVALYGPEHARTHTAARRLARVYADQGRPGAQAEWETRAASPDAPRPRPN